MKRNDNRVSREWFGPVVPPHPFFSSYQVSSEHFTSLVLYLLLVLERLDLVQVDGLCLVLEGRRGGLMTCDPALDVLSPVLPPLISSAVMGSLGHLGHHPMYILTESPPGGFSVTGGR